MHAVQGDAPRPFHLSGKELCQVARFVQAVAVRPSLALDEARTLPAAQ